MPGSLMNTIAVGLPLLLSVFFFSCVQKKSLSTTTVPANLETSVPGATDPVSEFMKHAATLDSSREIHGDTLELRSGKFFHTGDKYALIARYRQYTGTTYELYRLENAQWNLLLQDSTDSPDGINYRFQDFTFDGVPDFIFCYTININGNEWYKLYQGPGLYNIPSFIHIPNPLVVNAGRHILSQYVGGVYDEHFKARYVLTASGYEAEELATIIFMEDGNEVINELCYYTRENDQLVKKYCKTGMEVDTLYRRLVFED